MNLLVTGGCGFIGSNFIKYVLNKKESQISKIVNFDRLSYAGSEDNVCDLKNHSKYLFIKGDLKSYVEIFDALYKHDITHVVFGLNTKLEEEHLLDSWALWGCTIKWKTMYEYIKHPAIKEITREIYKDLGTWGIVKKIIAMIPLKLLVVFRALRMKKKWNYHEITEKQLNSKISDIRKEYNINVYKLRNKLN